MLFPRSTRFVLASHRLPVKYQEGEGLIPTDGGLCSALRSAKIEDAALWVGCVGSDVPSRTVEELPSYCRNVNIPKEIFGEFYNGYSNSVVWPAFHDRMDLVDYKESYWDAYVKVNQLFAEKIMTSTPRHMPVWIHDYQLMLVPYIIKKNQPSRNVNFFLHIPWPNINIANQLPHMSMIVQSLVASDAACFHCEEYVWHLRNYISENLSGAKNTLQDNLHVIPIGIDHEGFKSSVVEPTDQEFFWNEKYTYWSGMKNIVGVDRLDYSKGLMEKVEIYAEFLELNPEWRSKVCLRQLLIPSRDDVPIYAQYRQQVLNLVDYVNSKFGTEDWLPIDLFVGRTSQQNLQKIYRAGDFCWVNSYKDGMNLVALEYLASQNPDHPGLLVLSDQAGCANYLDGPLLFNGRSPIDACRTLRLALEMSEEEKHARHEGAMNWVVRNSVSQWVNRNMELLIQSGKSRRMNQDVTHEKTTVTRGAV